MNHSMRLKYRKLNDGRVRYCVFYKLTKSNGVSYNVRLFYCDIYITDKTVVKIVPYLTFNAKSDEFGQLYNNISKHTKIWKMLKVYLQEPVRIMGRYVESKAVDKCMNPDDVYLDIVNKFGYRDIDMTTWAYTIAADSKALQSIVGDLIDRLVRRELCKPVKEALVNFSVYSSTNFGRATRLVLTFVEQDMGKILGFKK